MISNLNRTDFIKRLEENTKIGNPKIIGTPFGIFTIFGKTKMKFYGEYTDSAFRLTKNAILFQIPYIFEGTLISKNKTSTEIKFNIRPIWFGYLWIRVLPVLALLLFNFLAITKGNNIESEIFVIVNVFLVFMFTPIFLTIRLKNKLLKDFKKIFDVSDR
ncbi:hypothetical protein BY457_1472 [Marinilabilia salmonicolor]|jgi:hypothetical protein|uniref:hypothetical protein n=1 Tax=Marinilabilia salmonicolor TaxID=989 RepID=UPI000D073BE3|nr:hypothetical protein [Marinilabilia salmonicolor]PRY85418.1 hypothetical protein BY457_1472 [Marinilabilia salmonicolor]